MRLAAIIAVGVLGAFAVFFVSQPSEYHIGRSLTVKATPEQITTLMSDLRVLTKVYPAYEQPTSRTYSAEPVGVGAWTEAVYEKRTTRTTVAEVARDHVLWRFNSGGGAGELQIRLDVVPADAGANATLSIHGQLFGVRRALFPFVSLDMRVGPDLDKALAAMSAELSAR